MNDTLTPQPAPVDASPARRSVSDAVLEQLGRPRSLFRVDAKRTWGNNYRVNVYCSDETSGTVRRLRLTDSFFVNYTDGTLASEPPVRRRY